MERDVDSLLRRLTRASMRRAISGEHWAWFVVGGAAFVLRRARRRDGSAARIHLRSGDRYVIEVHDVAGGAARRRGGQQESQQERRDGATPRVIWHGERIATRADRPE